MKNKTTLSLLCLCILSLGLLHRQNLIQANSSPSQQVVATAQNTDDPNSIVEQLLAKTQQTRVWAQAIKLNPQDAEAHHQLGLVLVSQNQVEQGISHYRQAIALQPPNVARIYQSWGKALVKQNKTGDAIATFRQGIMQGYPDAPQAMQEAEVHFRLGLALEREGSLSGAIKAYRQAISIQPDPLIYEYLGHVLVKHHALDEALVAFRQALPKSKSDRAGYKLLGDALVRENRANKALAAYRASIESRIKGMNSNLIAHTQMAAILSSMNRPEQAIATYRMALKLGDEQEQRSTAQALMPLLLDQNRIAEAKDLSQVFFQSDHPFQEAYAKHLIEQSKHLIKANHLDRAAKTCHQAAQIINNTQFPTRFSKTWRLADTWSCQGQIQSRRGQLETALASYQKAYQLYQANQLSLGYWEVVWMLIKLQRPEEALAILLQESSQKVQAYTHVGAGFITNQQPQAAARYCRQALAVDAQNLEAHYCLASASNKTDRLAATAQLFQQRSKEIPIKVIQHAYRANRLGNDAIRYKISDNIHEDEKAITALPHLATLRLYQRWGDILAQQEKQQEAIAAYHQTLRLLPEDAQTYTSLGQVLMQQQQYGGAIAAYRRAIQLSPYESQTYVNISKALQVLGEVKTANLALQQAVQLGWQKTSQGN